jgi:hypothetical protein
MHSSVLFVSQPRSCGPSTSSPAPPLPPPSVASERPARAPDATVCFGALTPHCACDSNRRICGHRLRRALTAPPHETAQQVTGDPLASPGVSQAATIRNGRPRSRRSLLRTADQRPARASKNERVSQTSLTLTRSLLRFDPLVPIRKSIDVSATLLSLARSDSCFNRCTSRSAKKARGPPYSRLNDGVCSHYWPTSGACF